MTPNLVPLRGQLLVRDERSSSRTRGSNIPIASHVQFVIVLHDDSIEIESKTAGKFFSTAVGTRPCTSAVHRHFNLRDELRALRDIISEKGTNHDAAVRVLNVISREYNIPSEYRAPPRAREIACPSHESRAGAYIVRKYDVPDLCRRADAPSMMTSQVITCHCTSTLTCKKEGSSAFCARLAAAGGYRMQGKDKYIREPEFFQNLIRE